MIVLAMRTDKAEAELYLYKDGNLIATEKWHAHRELSDTIHKKIELLLASSQLTFAMVEKVIIYAGPGSFTGLRIGHSVANAFAYGLGIPVVSVSGNEWLNDGLAQQIDTFVPVSPFYGAEANITKPKK